MTVHVTPAIRGFERAPVLGHVLGHVPGPVPRIVECAGYLADETVFDMIRTGVEAAVTRSAIPAPVYICHSLGCFIGLDAASREPGATVIAINMPASPWHGFRRACVAAARMTHIAGLRGVDEANLYRDSWIYFGCARRDDLVRQRLKQVHQAANCYRVPRRRDSELFLRSVLLEHRRRGPHVPRVLLVQGESDPIAPERDAVLLRKRLPDSVLVTIRGAHVLPVTHPREIIREVEGFLARG